MLKNESFGRIVSRSENEQCWSKGLVFEKVRLFQILSKARMSSDYDYGKHELVFCIEWNKNKKSVLDVYVMGLENRER